MKELLCERQHISAGDEDEWHVWQNKGDPVLHIDLRKWADLLVIAPLSANSLAKMAQGLCDNCLTSVVRAWDFTKPLLVRFSGYNHNRSLFLQRECDLFGSASSPVRPH